MSGSRLIPNVLTYLVLAVALVLALAPILWVTDNSFKTIVEITQYPPHAFGFHATWANYENLFRTSDFLSSTRNSAIVTAGSTLVSVGAALCCAYALVRLRAPLGRVLVIGLVSLQTVPGIVLVVPLFYLATTTHLYDTAVGLIIVYSALNVPFATWIMVAFIKGIPEELEDAAMVDGATRLATLRHIVLPLVAPGLGSAAIFTAIASWNQFLIPVVLTQSRSQTATVYITRFITETTIDWGSLCAAAILVMLPIVVFASIAQRRLVAGVTVGSFR